MAENIASPLRARKTDPATIKKRVQSVAELLRIDHLLERKPGEISGGQKQRTALGRTLVADPDVFLLDEPISHLDAKIRHELRQQFHTLEDLRRVATLYVTHDYAEALSLGDRIGVMGSGGLVQSAPRGDLFERPANLFVAQHLGQPTINVIPAQLESFQDKLYLRAEQGDLVRCRSIQPMRRSWPRAATPKSPSACARNSCGPPMRCPPAARRSPPMSISTRRWARPAF